MGNVVLVKGFGGGAVGFFFWFCVFSDVRAHALRSSRYGVQACSAFGSVQGLVSLTCDRFRRFAKTGAPCRSGPGYIHLSKCCADSSCWSSCLASCQRTMLMRLLTLWFTRSSLEAECICDSWLGQSTEFCHYHVHGFYSCSCVPCQA